MRSSLDIPVWLQRVMLFFQDTAAYLHRMMPGQPDKPVSPQCIDIFNLKCDKQIKSWLFEEKWEDVRALLHHHLAPLQYILPGEQQPEINTVWQLMAVNGGADGINFFLPYLPAHGIVKLKVSWDIGCR